MELKDIAAVAGKPGLYKIIKPTRTGLILESLDADKKKFATSPNHRVSVLNEISIYTTELDKTVPLQDILYKIHQEFGDDLGVDGKSDKEELFAFMKEIVPDFDTDKVYPSDIKKIINWYGIVWREAKEVLDQKPEEKLEETQEAEGAEEKPEKAPTTKPENKKGKKPSKPDGEKKDAK